MKINFKLFALADIVAWSCVIVYLALSEVLLLTEPAVMYFGIVAVAFVLGVHIYLFCVLSSNRKRIELLKQQYIDSIKPVAPLRFCPTDEDLVKKYTESSKSRHETLSTKVNSVNTDEKTLNEEEMEIS